MAVVARFATRATWSRGAIGAFAAKLGTTEGGADKACCVSQKRGRGGRGTYSAVKMWPPNAERKPSASLSPMPNRLTNSSRISLGGISPT